MFSDLKSLFTYTELANNQYVAQKYIEKPMVVMGRKFDIRQMVIVKSLNPLVIFQYNDCYLRFCSIEYSTDNLDDRYAHLSNHQVQKEYPKHHETPFPDNQWSLSTFRTYLKEQNNGNDKWLEINEKIKLLITTTIKSWPQEGHRNNSFELLGFDILLSEDYEPMLLEVNTNPGLHLLTEVVKVHHANKHDLFGQWEPIHVGDYNPSIIPIKLAPNPRLKTSKNLINKIN
eukprot:gene12806-15028_t